MKKDYIKQNDYIDNLVASTKRKFILAFVAMLIIAGYLGFIRLTKGEQIDKRNATRDSLTKVEASSQVPTTQKNNSKEKNKSQLLAELQQEQKVKEAIITDANVLYISVLDDGTNRDALADYFCSVAKPYGLDLRIKIVKYGSTKAPDRDNAYGVLLGKSDCQY